MPKSRRIPSFELATILPEPLLQAVTEVRIHRPETIQEEAAKRARRRALAPDGRLVIIAADHPGRMVLAVPGDPVRMGDRYDYLARVYRALTAPGVDGVMGTPDLLEELFILQRLLVEAGGERFLDEKVLIGSMNRGGLQGAVFEMEDRFTAFTPERLEGLGLDGGKMMVRIDLASEGSGRTLGWCAEAVTALNRKGIPAFLEPLPVKKRRGRYEVEREPEAMIEAISVAAALGESSLGLWLKVAITREFSRVARATTCPLLLLGGEVRGMDRLLADLSRALAAGPNVRGALIGRNVLFPDSGDPRQAAQRVAELVRDPYHGERKGGGTKLAGTRS